MSVSLHILNFQVILEGGGGNFRYFLIPFEIRTFSHSKNHPVITTLVDWA